MYTYANPWSTVHTRYGTRRAWRTASGRFGARPRRRSRRASKKTGGGSTLLTLGLIAGAGYGIYKLFIEKKAPTTILTTGGEVSPLDTSRLPFMIPTA